jgi:hypothetical protein
MNRASAGRPGVPRAILIACILAFSLVTVALQVRVLGVPYLDSGEQWARHRAVIEGTAIDPWQYRILSEWIVEGMLKFVLAVGAAHPVLTTFVLVRVLQNILIFSLAVAYLRTYRLSDMLVLIGLACLAWGMTHAGYNSDLQVGTYSDVIFYLVAALLVIRGRSLWVPAVCALAVLNRETGLLISLLALGEQDPIGSGRPRMKRRIALVAIAILLAAAVVVGLRLAYGPRPPGIATPPLGLATLLANVSMYQSWVFLFATLGPLPVMAVLGRAAWPARLRIWFWALVPIWCLVHLVAAMVAEARLFLVPHVLVFIPGTLLAIDRAAGGVVGGTTDRDAANDGASRDAEVGSV